MDATLGAAGLAVATGIVTTLWNTGGRAALERRAIREEIDIAKGLRDGLVRRQLRLATEQRVALYIYRRVGPGRGRRFHLMMVASVVGAYAAISVLSQLIDVGPSWFQLVARLAFLAATALFGLFVAFWLSESWRDHVADLRRNDLIYATQRLRDLESVRKPEQSD